MRRSLVRMRRSLVRVSRSLARVRRSVVRVERPVNYDPLYAIVAVAYRHFPPVFHSRVWKTGYRLFYCPVALLSVPYSGFIVDYPQSSCCTQENLVYNRHSAYSGRQRNIRFRSVFNT